MPIEQKKYEDYKPLCFRRNASDFQPSFQQDNKLSKFVSELQRGLQLISKS